MFRHPDHIVIENSRRSGRAAALGRYLGRQARPLGQAEPEASSGQKTGPSDEADKPEKP
jgi:hypothetical protein